MNGKEYTNFIIDNERVAIIKDMVAKVSSEMFDYINDHFDSKYIMFYKTMTHSDLATFGKATRPNMLNKNLLYYIDEKEMLNIEEKTGKTFQTAHQSCIGLKEKLYEIVGLPNPRTTNIYKINDYMSVKVVNSNLKYFSSFYTNKVFEKLNKSIDSRAKKSWDFKNLNLNLSNGLFTEITLHCAVHGLGTSEDEEFHKLRHHLFKGDTFILLFELNKNYKNVFILLDKNPIFFNIIGEVNKTYVQYQELLRKRIIDKTLLRDNVLEYANEKKSNSVIEERKEIDEEVTRQQQATWRKMLADEMMGYTQTDGEVFCPFTYITADFNTLGTLFVASHIKGFKDKNTTDEEKYDINNGLLLSVQADALFDKHLISIREDKTLAFSFLLDSNIRLKSQLLLLQPIFEPILNANRMKYLKYHYNMFLECEEKRKRI